MYMKLQKNPTRRRGFTLSEILIVIGIILLLMGVFLVAIRKPSNTAKTQLTKVIMSNIKSEMDELKRVNAMDKLDVIYPTPMTQTQGMIFENMTWKMPNAESLAVLNNTGAAMKVLQIIPANKTLMTQVSRDRVATLPNGNILFLDGWGNPILFIPKTGFPLEKDMFGLPKGGLLTSVGILANKPDGTHPSIPANAKPFWMSAGPNGDFGDLALRNAKKPMDNICSFEQ
jgi:prepilin-type N-terminal cleavage/methylation domain-containing protein